MYTAIYVVLAVDGSGVSVVSGLDIGAGALGGDDRGAVLREVVVNHARSAYVVLWIQNHR